MILDWLLDPLQYEFMVRAFATTVVAAIVCALLSCWLVLIGWSLMGDAVSHAVLPGVVIAAMIDIPFAVGALLAALIAVGMIGGVREAGTVREDAAMGIVFTALFSLGLILIARFPSGQDLHSILFGSVLGVRDSDLVQVLTVSAFTVIVLLAFRRDLIMLAFDRLQAHTLGLRTRTLTALLLATLATATVAGVQSVGVILVVATLIVPGATAQLVAGTMRGTMIVAVVVETSSSRLVLVVQVAREVRPLERAHAGPRPVAAVVVLPHVGVERGPDLGQEGLADAWGIGELDVDRLTAHTRRLGRAEVPHRPHQRLVVPRVRAGPRRDDQVGARVTEALPEAVDHAPQRTLHREHLDGVGAGRGDDDDPTHAQQAGRGLEHQEAAPHVLGHDLVELALGETLERSRAGVGGEVHDAAERTEDLEDLLVGRQHVHLRGHVGLDGDGLTTELLDLGRRLGREVDVTVSAHHVVAGSPVRQRHGATEALAHVRDQHDPRSFHSARIRRWSHPLNTTMDV